MAKFTLKYNLKKEFLHFLHEENIYNDFLYMIRNYSIWNPLSIAHFFDYVDARMYLQNMCKYSFDNEKIFPYKLFCEKRKLWEYYYVLWEIKLLSIDKITFEDKKFILNDIYNRGFTFNYQNTLYVNKHFIDKLSSIFNIYKEKYNISTKDLTELDFIQSLLNSMKVKLYKKENNIQETLTWENIDDE